MERRLVVASGHYWGETMSEKGEYSKAYLFTQEEIKLILAGLHELDFAREQCLDLIKKVTEQAGYK